METKRRKDKRTTKGLEKVPNGGSRLVSDSDQKGGGPTSQAIGKLVIDHLRRGGSRQDIPYLLPSFRRGTEIVEMRLFTDYIAITTTTGTLYNTVQSVKFSGFGNASDLVNVFEEVRPVRGKIYYFPRSFVTGSTLVNMGGAAVDYASSGAITAAVNMLQHDTHCIFTLFTGNQGGYKLGKKYPSATACWALQFDGTPDRDWQDTIAPTDVAWWKPYFATTEVTTTATVGYLLMWVDWQFRQVR